MGSEEPDRPPGVSTYADRTWIVNSRNTADEDAVRTLGALAGFARRIGHQIDSLELVEDLIVAEYGVGLLPVGRPTGSSVKVVPLADPTVVLTAMPSLEPVARRDPRCAWCWIGCGRRRDRRPARVGRAPPQFQVHQSASHRRAKQPS